MRTFYVILRRMYNQNGNRISKSVFPNPYGTTLLSVRVAVSKTTRTGPCGSKVEDDHKVPLPSSGSRALIAQSRTFVG
jgi:hypothetical protein